MFILLFDFQVLGLGHDVREIKILKKIKKFGLKNLRQYSLWKNKNDAE